MLKLEHVYRKGFKSRKFEGFGRFFDCATTPTIFSPLAHLGFFHAQCGFKRFAEAICPYVYGLHEGNSTGMLSDFQIPSSKVFGGLPQAASPEFEALCTFEPVSPYFLRKHMDET